MNDPTRTAVNELDDVPSAERVAETVAPESVSTHTAASGSVVVSDLLALGTLAGYRIAKKLGEGGMGAVYSAEDLALKRPVALKTLRADHSHSTEARARFLREAQAAAAVQSDHVVRIYQVGEERGIPFIAMEYLRGKPLDAWMKGHVPALTHILKIGYETALGLGAAHDLGLVHRDIKPSNLWLESPGGRVKILDFGLARPARESGELTGTGVILGTPAYMAPEQARGLPVDHRCDLFSLGCVLYHLATGRRPFTGTDTMAILTSLAVDTPEAPHIVNAAIPASLSSLILRLLEKKPENRPANAAAVAEEIRRIHKGESVPAAASESLPVVYAPPAAGTVWGEIAVSGTVDDVVTVPTPKRGNRAALLIGSIAGMAVIALAVGAFLQMAKHGTPKPTVADEPEVAKDKPKPIFKKGGKAEEPPPGNLIPPMTPYKPEKIFSLDYLDPKDIPAEERFPWQPKELVAVLGSHRQRLHESPRAEWAWMVDGGRTVWVNDRRWDMATRKELTPLPEGKYARTVSNDGNRIAYGATVGSAMKPDDPWTSHALGNRSISRFLFADVVLCSPGGEFRVDSVWKLDAKEPKLLANLEGYQVATASANGRILAVAKDRGAPVEIHEVKEDAVRKLHDLPGDSGIIRFAENGAGRSLSVSDGGRLAMTANSKVVIWDDVTTKPKIRHEMDWKDPKVRVRLADNGDRVVIFGEPFFEVWDLAGAMPKKITNQQGDVLGWNIAWVLPTPDGNRFVSGHMNGSIRFWEVEKGVLLERSPLPPQPTVGDQSQGVCADGKLLSCRSEGLVPHLWNLAAFGTPPAQLLNSKDYGFPAIFRRDGTAVVTPTVEGTVLDLKKSPPAPIGATGPAYAGAFSPDDSHYAACVLTADQRSFELALWSMGQNPTVRFKRPISVPWYPMFSANGQYLFAFDTGQVLLSLAVTDTGLFERDRYQAGGSVYGYATSPDGRTIALAGLGGIEILDVKDGKLALRHNLSSRYSSVAFAPDGKKLWAFKTYTEARLQLIDPASGKVEREWNGFPGPIQHIIAHPDGRHLIVSNFNHTIYILRIGAEPPKK